MEYTKQTWTAPTGTGLSRYAKSAESASHVTLTLDPVNLTNTPTPITVARLNHMEDGIAKAYDTAKKWKTARNITISDADGTNTGTAVSVDGSENETLKLPSTIKASLTGNASTALAIKPLGNYIALPTVPTAVTRIIMIATVSWDFAGTINMICSGRSTVEEIKVSINSAQNTASGIRVIYSKVIANFGIKKIIVTRDTGEWNSARNIYAEISTPTNGSSTTTLGVVETNRGTFTPSMTEVSSITGTVVDSLSLDYLRGDISSYQHVFTKNIIGNLTGNVTGNLTGNVTGSAGNVSKANVRVSLRHGDTWFAKTWTGLGNFIYYFIWTDGENIYYSGGTTQYVLNKTTSAWVAKTWVGLTDFHSIRIWTDGENIYHSYLTAHHVLNKTTSTWSVKTWTGLTDFIGENIWTDGENIYYSNGTTQFVLNKVTSTWVAKAWTGLTDFIGENIWTDGENIYYSKDTTQYVLNKTTSAWVAKTWTGLTNFSGYDIWKDGENIYHSAGSSQYQLNKTTSAWVAKTWTGLTNFSGYDIWTDGENIYYSAGSTHQVLPATRHNYVDDDKYNSLFGIVTKCNCSTLSDRFVFNNE